MEKYVEEGRLHPWILFATFDVSDLYTTMLPHDGTIAALGRFLTEYTSDHKLKGMSMDTIIRLTQVVLNNNIFIYDDKLYRQIKGGAMGSPLTLPEGNIYMFYWQIDLVSTIIAENEIF